jgi:hypothetical protein
MFPPAANASTNKTEAAAKPKPAPGGFLLRRELRHRQASRGDKHIRFEVIFGFEIFGKIG